MIGGKEHFLILEALKRCFGTFYCILCMLLLKNAFIEKTEKNRKGYFSFLFKTGGPVPRTFSGSSALHNISPSCKVNACYRVYVYFFTSLLFAKIFLQMTHICINFPGFFKVFLEVVYTWNFIPGWNSSGMKSYLSMVKCLLLFTRFCRDEISSRDEKKRKKDV